MLPNKDSSDNEGTPIRQFPLPEDAKNNWMCLSHFPAKGEELKPGFQVANTACDNCIRHGCTCTYGTRLMFNRKPRLTNCDLCITQHAACNGNGYMGHMTPKKHRIKTINENLIVLQVIVNKHIPNDVKDVAYTALYQIRRNNM
uniref:Uncharacterized protein n=1 Tax=Ustilago esculenta TaxID=185366 RepID=A0A481SH65_9BASI|nr:hypothetical protein UE_1383 [Ustilago esculenta]